MTARKCGARNGSYVCQHVMRAGALHHEGMHHTEFRGYSGLPRVAYWHEPYGAVSFRAPME